MSEDDVQVRPEDVLQVAQRALGKCNDLEKLVEDLGDRVVELEGELTSVNLRLSAIDDDRSYRDLSTDEKVGKVREELFEQATDGRGRTMDYADVRDVVFDGKPSADHCYKLMRLAAGVDTEGNEVQDVSGFSFRESTRPKKLLVDPDEARRGWAFSSANKTVSEGGRSG